MSRVKHYLNQVRSALPFLVNRAFAESIDVFAFLPCFPLLLIAHSIILVTEKHTSMLVKDKKYAVAVSDMQGWRISKSTLSSLFLQRTGSRSWDAIANGAHPRIDLATSLIRNRD